MKALALAAIRFYQRVISPRKGFCCAYRSCTGRASCSTLGYRAIRRHGVIDGIAVLRLRLQACGDVYREHVRKPPSPLQAQAGFCDCDLPCDFDGGGSGKSGLCNCLSDCASFDWPGKKKRQENGNRRGRRGNPQDS